MARYGIYRKLNVLELNATGKPAKASVGERKLIVLNWKKLKVQEAEIKAAERLGLQVNTAYICLDDHNMHAAVLCYVVAQTSINTRLATRIDKGGQILSSGSSKTF